MRSNILSAAIIAAGIVAAAALLRPSGAVSAMPPTQLEYKATNIPGTPAGVEEAFNKLGRDGWSYAGDLQSSNHIALFYRQRSK